MKKILITGADSYIGTSFEKYMAQFGGEYLIDTVDMIGDGWKSRDFSGYDCVFHVAGIVHRKETAENASLYYKVNRDLAVAAAKKAKKEGVKQFILLSSMSVYGMDLGVITKDTPTHPRSHYGRSKLQAEKMISKLDCESFKVAVLRPPMVYGDGCKGNYQAVVRLVRLSPVFPKVNNRRSLLHVDELCRYLKKYIDSESSGVFFPQNRDYVNTSDLAVQTAEKLGKRIYLSRILGLIIGLFGGFFSVTRKAFGTLIYSMDGDGGVPFPEAYGKKKKVLFVATVVKLHINVFHIPYLKMFKDMGWETIVASKNDFENKEECVIPYCDRYYDIPFERFPLKTGNIRAFRELKRIIDLEKPDIIHCHTPVGSILARIAAIGARRRGTQVVYTAHGFHFFDGAPKINWLLYYPAELLCSFLTDDIITMNRQDYDRAKTMFAGRVHLVSGVGVDISRFGLSREICRKKLTEELDIPDGAVIITSVGEINKNKNQQLVIEALHILNDESIHYLACGVGDETERLKKLTKRYGLQNNVHFPGYRNDIPDILAATDIFVFPSYREGLPVSVIEAMAAGCPIIGTKIRGTTDLVKQDINGYMTDPWDAAGFSDRIGYLAHNEAVRRNMSQKSREMAEKYDIHNVLEQVGRIYKYK